MKKRQFLSTAAGSIISALGVSAAPAHATTSVKTSSQVILTVAGAIDRSNRGKTDNVIDQMMYKQGVHFSRAYTFDLAALEKLPSVTISPTLEYDGQPHKLSGPRLIDMLDFVGAKKTKDTRILFHSIDGYAPEASLDQVRKYDFILATKIDGKSLSIGGLGPIFAIYDADRIADFSQKPLNQRFAICPWGLYYLEVVTG